MELAEYPVDYSMVVCVYNPDKRILSRCLRAVSKLELEGMRTELILADNNSDVPVSSLSYVKKIAEKIALFKIIHVQDQGVKYARMAAIDAAVGKYIVYFDYDNEPAKDYLQELKKLNAAYPQVAAWGPGNVSVDFIDGIDEEIEEYGKIAFQERHDEELEYASERDWQACYPFGTGLCTYKFLLDEYNRLARKGGFTLPGRSGTKLTSGEDTQMVMLCISKGYSAGVSPSLKLTHMIPGTRANALYLKRMAYGTSFCYATCMLQVFPDYVKTLEYELLTPFKFSMQSVKKYYESTQSRHPHKTFELAKFIGMQAGKYFAVNKPLPAVVKKISKSLEFD